MKLDLIPREHAKALIAAAWADAEPGLEYDGKPDRIWDLRDSVVEIYETPAGTFSIMSASLLAPNVQLIRP